MKWHLIDAMWREMNGPRYGNKEQIYYNPLLEYMTGVLVGKDLGNTKNKEEELPEEDEIDSNVLTDSLDINSSEDNTDDGDLKLITYKKFDRPSSMGIKIFLKENPSPLDALITWGIYNQIRDVDVRPENKEIFDPWVSRKLSNEIMEKDTNEATQDDTSDSGDANETTQDDTLNSEDTGESTQDNTSDSEDTDESDEKLNWYERFPQNKIVRNIDPTKQDDIYFDLQGNEINPDNASSYLRLAIRPKNVTKGWVVSIYLVNEYGYNYGHSYQSEKAIHAIFQPEIRLKLKDTNSKLAIGDVESFTQFSDEMRVIEKFYSQRNTYAIGKFCSAYWWEIDPMRFSTDEVKSLYPFYWFQNEELSKDVITEFSKPDYRSTFIPIYLENAPNYTVDTQDLPDLSAENLAENYPQEKLAQELSKLIYEYETWVREVKDAEISYHSSIIESMKNSIDLIRTDKSVYLAFCFANKAIAIQNSWKSSTEFIWRPFQMAFILLVIESIVVPDSKNKNTCDLLWVSTGAGKTEAYLGIMAFVLGYRRLTALSKKDFFGSGTTIITRYTLRLLTVQQFRRTAALTVACNYLRIYSIHGSDFGWIPKHVERSKKIIWGYTPFSIGIWVGGKMTPNTLYSTSDDNLGAIQLLQKPNDSRQSDTGEPAQILTCPACNTILSYSSKKAIEKGNHRIFYLIWYTNTSDSFKENISKIIDEINEDSEDQNIKLLAADLIPLKIRPNFVLQLEIEVATDLDSQEIKKFISKCFEKIKGVKNLSANILRPGYFIKKLGNELEFDFDIFCINPECMLNKFPYFEFICNQDNKPEPYVPYPFLTVDKSFQQFFNLNIYTCDEQIYHRLPSIIVSTVDKFALLPFKPESGAIFGKVDHFDKKKKWFERHGEKNPRGRFRISNIPPPQLIIQDELHLINGPLGSMVGLFETAIDELAQKPKYIASTATINQARMLIQNVFQRKTRVFPYPSKEIDDMFFVRTHEKFDPNDEAAGRIYIGILPTGGKILTANIRVWARLLLSLRLFAESNNQTFPKDLLDKYWTIVGYFNSIRELSGARAAFGQDIVERFKYLSAWSKKPDFHTKDLEISSRLKSAEELPSVINELNQEYPNAIPAVFSTSMFGTGVDISRLSTMIILGQPKTTASYIQASGRVGRKNKGLIFVIYKQSAPRDMGHYENFIGYHRRIKIEVEPSTVTPFTLKSIEKAGGSVLSSLLRLDSEKFLDKSAKLPPPTSSLDATNNLINSKINLILSRLESQSNVDKNLKENISTFFESSIDKWKKISQKITQMASQTDVKLLWKESSLYRLPSNHVVLGSFAHELNGDLKVVYHLAPYSLRDVEGTIGMQPRLTNWRDAVGMRISQLITTYGPGSILETPSGSVIIPFPKPKLEINSFSKYKIRDVRLENVLGKGEIFEPPYNALENKPDIRILYKTTPFPRYLLCNNSDDHKNKRKLDYSILYTSKNFKERCPICKNRGNSIRFLLACKNGHIDDLDWSFQLHKKQSPSCKNSMFYVQIFGSELSEYNIICPSCNKRSTFRNILYNRISNKCRGSYNLIPGQPSTSCDEKVSVVQKQSSMVWLPNIITLLTIPPIVSEEIEIIKIVYDEMKKTLEAMGFDGSGITGEKLLRRYEASEYLSKDIENTFTEKDVDKILDAIRNDERRSKDLESLFDLEGAEKYQKEYEKELQREFYTIYQFASGSDLSISISKLPSMNKYFEVNNEDLTKFSVKSLQFFATPISLLREVSVLKSFNRLIPLSQDESGKSVEVVAEDGGRAWYIGKQSFGEGIFISLEEDSFELLNQSLEKYIDANQGIELMQSTAKFIWWHTLSHYLNRLITLYSGFSSASMKERVYVSNKCPEGGIIIYTTGNSADGTMGGLVSLIQEIPKFIEFILNHQVNSCSNDPICMEQKLDLSTRIGAACFACTFISETACRENNYKLDRNILKSIV